MNPRLSAFAGISLAISLAPIRIAAQTPVPRGNPAVKSASGVKSTSSTIPRLPGGRPDIGGFWSNNTATPLQRPQALAGREFLTDDEAKALERASRTQTQASDRQAVERPKEVGDYNAVFKEDSRWALPNKRTSIITDPKDGRLPPFTPEAEKKFKADQEYHREHPHDGPEDMTTIERCITWITSGPPMQ